MNKKLTGLSQILRKAMTEEERRLWHVFLKHLPLTIHRQKVIGPYIADFYCAEKKLIIELDGSQHFEKAGQEKDQERDAYMTTAGITVLRYSNLQIKRNFKGVCQDILNHIDPDGSYDRLWGKEQDKPERIRKRKTR